MTKVKVEKHLIISFIGLIVIFFVGLGGNIVLKAGLPASSSQKEVNFENRLQSLEKDLESGHITNGEYDSLVGLLRIQIERTNAVNEGNHNPDKMPEWVSKLGISEPVGLKFDPIFSSYTFLDDPKEGFNSVSLVYTGSYETAVSEAARIATEANLFIAGNFKAKGSPAPKVSPTTNYEISYLNYSLGHTDNDFLISVQVEPSGRLKIMVTDNKQLNERLLVYAPLNNRQNSAAKLKKQ